MGHSIDSSFIGPRAFNFLAVEKVRIIAETVFYLTCR